LKRKVTTPSVVKKFNDDDDGREDLYFPQETAKRNCRREDNLKPPQLPQLPVNVPQTTVGQSSSSSTADVPETPVGQSSSSSMADAPVSTPFTNAATKGLTLTQETARTKDNVKRKILRLREEMPHYVTINTEEKLRPLLRQVSAFAISCDCQSKIACTVNLSLLVLSI
jgi:hypothetical protein